MKKTIALIILASAFSGCVQFKTRSGYEAGFDATSGTNIVGHASDPVGNSMAFDIPNEE
jgi:hypothetical protein